jgi:hypothetical protein
VLDCQQHTVDRDDVNLSPGSCDHAVIIAADSLFPLVVRRYD